MIVLKQCEQKMKDCSFNGIKFLDKNEIVHRCIRQEFEREVIVENYNLIQEKGLSKYLPNDITFCKKEITYRYVVGDDLEYCYKIKPNLLYLKMFFDFFNKKCFLSDISRSNVIYDGKKLVIVDLDTRNYVFNRIDFLKEIIKRFFECWIID